MGVLLRPQAWEDEVISNQLIFFAISSRPSPMADSWAIVSGVGVDISTHHLHPGNPENNFLEHQELFPQMDSAERGKNSTSSTQPVTQSNTFQAILV